jgi:membrane-associated phospholipid phosphatase
MESKNTGIFFLKLSAPLFIVLVFSCLAFPKAESFITLNFYHSSSLNSFFEIYTYLGDGLFPTVLAVLLLIWRKYELGIKVLSSFLLSGLVAQILKAIFHAPRPKAFLANGTYPYFIDGVTHSGLTSFPSGHSTTAFALAATLAFNTQSKYKTLAYFLLATLTLYSRIYLGQHFLEDTTAGVFIGTSTAIGVEYLSKRVKFRLPKKSSRINNEPITIEF